MSLQSQAVPDGAPNQSTHQRNRQDPSQTGTRPDSGGIDSLDFPNATAPAHSGIASRAPGRDLTIPSRAAAHLSAAHLGRAHSRQSIAAAS